MTRAKHNRPQPTRSRGQQWHVRIIAGRWRGRRLLVPDVPELRPTGDRIRETLFNWLSPVISQARCLDLFAGSGVLGFECLSRGARDVVLVERSGKAYENLEILAAQFDKPLAKTVCADAMHWLNQSGIPAFDIIFLDPPFDFSMLNDVCGRLEQTGKVCPGGYIYIEQDQEKPTPVLPSSWTIIQEKKSGRVRYYLARRI